MGNRLTQEAVCNQLWAMGCRRYEFMLHNEYMDDRIMRGPWPLQTAMKSVGFMTVKGWDCYNVHVRPDPAENRALVMVDDIDWTGVQTLAEEGFEPACVVETSWKNLQCWVDLGPAPMPPAERLNSARHLAETARGDLRAAASIHWGRLAGFRNLKDGHFDKGLKWGWPFVLCRQSRGMVCSKAEEERERAAKEVAEEVARIAGRPVRRRILRSGLPDVCRKAEQFCAEWLRRIRDQNKTEDLSRRDYAVICRLMLDGCSDSQIMEGMDPIVKRENKAGIREKHKTCLPRTISVVENDLFGTASSAELQAGD
ncbi:MAG: RepB family DNA primase [Desulfovibrio sp.]|nr:RepB family DNA primase [Desulfovibrio sp.]